METEKKRDSWVSIEVRVKSMTEMDPFLLLLYKVISRGYNCVDPVGTAAVQKVRLSRAANRATREHTWKRNPKP